jgi:hypothetical protein
MEISIETRDGEIVSFFSAHVVVIDFLDNSVVQKHKAL